MKVIKKETVSRIVVTDYTIKLDDGRKIKLWKEEGPDDSDWDYFVESLEIVNSLTDEQQEELYEFIDDLK